MKAVTIVVLVLAIVAGSVAIIFNMNTPQSPLSPNNGPTGNVTTKPNDKELLKSISDHSAKIGPVALVSTIEEGVYRRNDYSGFFSVSDDGIHEIEDVRSATVNAVVSGIECELDLSYVVADGRAVGGGSYERIIEQSGVYSLTLKLHYTLTEMPLALGGEEGERLLLVGYANDEYYSEAFAVRLSEGTARNLFEHTFRAEYEADGYVMLTDELVKSSGEYLYFFSSRLYDKQSEGMKFNPYKNIDLFRTRAGEEELVARQVHHNYLGYGDDGTLRFIRTDYATISYTVGQVPTVSFEERNFEVIRLNPETKSETVLMQSTQPYSSGYKRFGDMLVSLSQDDYGCMSVYDIVQNRLRGYNGIKMMVISSFDVSEKGRYIVAGGYTSSVSTVNQCIQLIDTYTLKTWDISGKGLFLAIDGNFGFVGSKYFINSDYDESETEITIYLTDIEKIKQSF